MDEIRYKTIKKKMNMPEVELDNEKAILNIETGNYHSLNSMASEIWGLIDDNKSIDNIITELLEQFDVSKETCEQEVVLFIKVMADNKLVTLS